jgi:hypothetical protein
VIVLRPNLDVRPTFPHRRFRFGNPIQINGLRNLAVDRFGTKPLLWDKAEAIDFTKNFRWLLLAPPSVRSLFFSGCSPTDSLAL